MAAVRANSFVDCRSNDRQHASEARQLPRCPRCEATMMLVRTTPGVASFPALLTFRCPRCDHFETREGEEDADGGLTRVGNTISHTRCVTQSASG